MPAETLTQGQRQGHIKFDFKTHALTTPKATETILVASRITWRLVKNKLLDNNLFKLIAESTPTAFDLVGLMGT